MKQAVLFDLDDTLVWDTRSVQEALAATAEYASAQCGVNTTQLVASLETEARKLYRSYATHPFVDRIGINPFEALWGDFSGGELPEFRQLEALVPQYRSDAWTRALLANGIDAAALGAELGALFPLERRKRPIVYEETFAVLEALRGQYMLVMLTNGAPDIQREKIASVPALAGYFDEIVVSGDFGDGKPAPALFAYTLERIGVRSEDAVMVGDKLTTDMLGAVRSGIHSVWINRTEQVRTGIAEPEYTIKNLQELLPIVKQVLNLTHK
jgi:putative hydrolase of the HAD superfamily